MANIVDLLGRPFVPPEPPRVDPPEVQLRDAMERAGITAPEQLVLDGTLHRFSTSGRRGDTAGWYVAFAGPVPAGAFGDWRTGSSHQWRAQIGRELSLAEQMAHTKRVSELRAIRDRELAERRESAAEQAQREWDSAALASDDHPYLISKGVSAHGLRVAGDGRLIAPVIIDGEIASLQFIAGDGSKLFLKGGAVTGGFWLLGSLSGAGSVFLCEGVATAISIHEATHRPTVAAFSAGNLKAVARGLRERLGPTCSITVVADNDVSGTGQREALEAATDVGGRLVIPPVEGMDANDYARAGNDLQALLQPPAGPEDNGYLIPADEFSAAPKPIRWLIKGHLQREALGMIHGPSGGGKTFIILDQALHVAAGLPQWCGKTVHGGPVVILAGEGHNGLRARIAAWKLKHNVQHLQAWVSRAGVDLNTPDGYLTARDALLALPVRPALIVIDTLHRFLHGDENSAQDAKSMIDACGGLQREFGCSVWLVHHTGVSEEAQHRARGSSAWRGALDIEASVIPKTEDEPMQLVQRKSKDSELAGPLWMRLEPVPLPWLDEDGEPVSSAVPVPVEHQSDQGEKPAEKPSSKVESAKRAFANAWYEIADEEKGGAPYLSRAALKRKLEGDGRSPRTVANDMNPAYPEKLIGCLIASRVIRPEEHGWVVIDPSLAAQMMLNKSSKAEQQ